MDLCIVGTGYVGLVTGACLADAGHRVACVDIDADKVAAINAGRAPMHEPGLAELLQRHAGGRLKATTDLAGAVTASELSLIAVGTPTLDGVIDLRHVTRAATDIGVALRRHRGYHTVVVKSTVVPGTTAGEVRRCLETASGLKAGVHFGLGMNPEFLTEGSAVRDCLEPDRLVLGGIDERSRQMLARLYADVAPQVPRIRTTLTTAEMIKYASNAFLATLISFSNEFGRLCSAMGDVDICEVLRGVHESAYLTLREGGARRAAPIAAFLEAGCGFGGSCLPKDVSALIHHAERHGERMPLLRSVLQINRSQPDEVLRLIEQRGITLKDRAVTVLGLAFKPDTDDLRESPAFPILRRLRDAGARLTAYDPVARPDGHPELEGVTLAGSLDAAVAGAEIVVLVTRWSEFRALPSILRRREPMPLLVDGRRQLAPSEYPHYAGIGRG